MKTIKLSTILLGAMIFLNLGSTALCAQDIKNAIAEKTPKVKTEARKSDAEKYFDARVKPKAYNKPEFPRNDNKDYQRGKIRTH